jgi:hypothetical protein
MSKKNGNVIHSGGKLTFKGLKTMLKDIYIFTTLTFYVYKTEIDLTFYVSPIHGQYNL